MPSRLPALATGLLIVVAATVAIVLFGSPSPMESRWTSDYGPLVLAVADDGSVSGSYPEHEGRIIAVLDPNGAAISGHWLQESSERPCSNEREGTPAWGRVWFEFAGSDRILGVWAYCDDEIDGSRTWNAGLTDGAHPRDVLRH